MPNKRVYYEVKMSGSDVLEAIYDPWDHVTIPLDERNGDYCNFLLLSASDRAIVITSGSDLGDVVDTYEIYSVTGSLLPVTGSL